MNKTLKYKAVCCLLGILFTILGSSCSQNNSLDLSSYLNTTIKSFLDNHSDFGKIDDLYDNSYSDNDNAVYLYLDGYDDKIDIITISKYCNYSIYNIFYGMDFSAACEEAEKHGSVIHENDSFDGKEYCINNNEYLYIFNDGDERVNIVKLSNTDTGSDDEDNNDSNDPYNTDGDYQDYNNDDDYYDPEYDYEPETPDLNDIGFADMMDYTEWCKLERIRYKDGKGYVDIESYGKCTIENGYCITYSFDSESMTFKERYSIYSFDVVDNDNALLTPKDTRTTQKDDWQITERHVFNNDNYVYLTIKSRKSEGPYIPCDFIDWSSGRKTTNDDGDTVYRFDII